MGVIIYHYINSSWNKIEGGGYVIIPTQAGVFAYDIMILTMIDKAAIPWLRF